MSDFNEKNNKAEQPIRPEAALREVFASMFDTYMADLRADVYQVNSHRLFNSNDLAMVKAYNDPSLNG